MAKSMNRLRRERMKALRWYNHYAMREGCTFGGGFWRRYDTPGWVWMFGHRPERRYRNKQMRQIPPRF